MPDSLERSGRGFDQVVQIIRRTLAVPAEEMPVLDCKKQRFREIRSAPAAHDHIRHKAQKRCAPQLKNGFENGFIRLRL